jgi:membrane associated rhomboid family serine protease
MGLRLGASLPFLLLLLLLLLLTFTCHHASSSRPLQPRLLVLPTPTAIAGGGGAGSRLAWTRPHSAQTGAQQLPTTMQPPFQPLPPAGAGPRRQQAQSPSPLLAYAGTRSRGGRGRGARRGGMGGGRGDGGFDLSNWTNRLLVLNVAVFFLQQVDPRVTLLGAKNDALIRRGEWHRLVTPMLLHGDVQHLLANSYTLYNLGHFIEPLFGAPTYLALYLLSGVAGNGLSFFSRRAPIAIGASTAVSGLLGAVGLFCVRHRKVWNLEGPLRSVTQAVVINGVLGASSRNIDNFGHLGGLLGGIACGFLFGPNLVSVRNADGSFRGYANLPLLQSAVAALRRRLGTGKGKGKGALSSSSSSAPSQRKRAALRPQEQQQQQQQQQQPSWLQRLGSFLHRGGESGGKGYAGAAFVGPLPPPLMAGGGGSRRKGRGAARQRACGMRPWQRQQQPRVWRSPHVLPLL